MNVNIEEPPCNGASPSGRSECVWQKTSHLARAVSAPVSLPWTACWARISTDSRLISPAHVKGWAWRIPGS